jgi:hypothetical protein
MAPQTPRGGAHGIRLRVGEPLDLAGGKWLLNPGAANEGYWLLLDLDGWTATWQRAPFDPVPARERARALGLHDPVVTARAGRTTRTT